MWMNVNVSALHPIESTRNEDNGEKGIEKAEFTNRKGEKGKKAKKEDGIVLLCPCGIQCVHA